MKTLFILHEQYGNYKECPGYTEIFRPMTHSGYIQDYRIFIYQRLYRQSLAKLFIENIKKIKNKKVVVYGVGKHTSSHLNYLTRLNISAFTDSNESYWHTELEGIPVIPPSDILSYGKDVLISSEAFEDEIEHKLIELYGSKICIHKIYNHRDFVHEAHKMVGEGLWSFVKKYNPSLIVYTPTWPGGGIRYDFFKEIKIFFNVKIVSIFWDFNESIEGLYIQFERETLEYADYVIENTSFTRLKRMRERIGSYSSHLNVEKVHWHPTIFDPTVFQKDTLDKRYDIAIFGSAENDRKIWIDFLKERYGDQFHHIGSLIDTNQRVSTKEYVRAINQTKIFVNTQTYSWRIQLKGKIREALSCGVFILEEDNEETRAFVPEGKGVIFFQGEQDLCEKIDYYLVHEDERNTIALEGYYWFHLNHSARRWTQTILETVGLLQKKV